MSKAKNLINEDEEYFAKSGRIKYYPLAIDYGYGATLVDVDGKEYIDLLSVQVRKMWGMHLRKSQMLLKTSRKICSLYASIHVS